MHTMFSFDWIEAGTHLPPPFCKKYLLDKANTKRTTYEWTPNLHPLRYGSGR